MIINFKVNGDTIKTSEKETFYTGNVNSYICEFEFSEDWDKAAAFCVMTNGKKSAVLYIADSKCTVPSEILSGKGTVKLGLYGTDGNKRISTNCVMLKVREGAYEIGADDMTMPIPDVWEQLVSKTVPKIGDNGNWLVWSMTENKYVDTGIYATVDIGEFYKKSETDKKLSGKVDKITGKGLSTNDYTDEEKEKLKGLSNYDDTEIKNEIGGKVDKVQGKGLSSNDYTAEEKTKLSELPSKTELDTDLSGKEDSANKVTTLDSNGTDTQYPSAKAVYDELVKKANATDLGLQFVNLGYLSETTDFDKLDITYNCYGCFRIRSDIWLNARLNASVSGDFKQGYNGNVLVDTLAPNITVYFIVRQGNTITKGAGSSETTSTQIFYSGDIYLRTIHKTSDRIIKPGGIEIEW